MSVLETALSNVGGEAAAPVSEWASMEGLAKDTVVARLEACGWPKPQGIQQLMVPPVVAGRDVVVQAADGAGKTTAVAVVAVNKVEISSPWCQVVVVSSDRRTANEVDAAVKQLSLYKTVTHRAVTSSASEADDARAVRKHQVQVLAGTPTYVHKCMRDAGESAWNAVNLLVVDGIDAIIDAGVLPPLLELVDAYYQARRAGVEEEDAGAKGAAGGEAKAGAPSAGAAGGAGGAGGAGAGVGATKPRRRSSLKHIEAGDEYDPAALSDKHATVALATRGHAAVVDKVPSQIVLCSDSMALRPEAAELVKAHMRRVVVALQEPSYDDGDGGAGGADGDVAYSDDELAGGYDP